MQTIIFINQTYTAKILIYFMQPSSPCKYYNFKITVKLENNVVFVMVKTKMYI